MARLAKIGFLLLVLVLCAGAIGAGYGAWSETLIINGTAEVGTVDAEFTWASGNETCQISGVGSNELTVTVPASEGCYVIDYTLENTGSIPVKISSINDITEPAGVTTVGITGMAVDVVMDAEDSTGGTISIWVDGEDEYTVTVTVEVTQWNK